MNKRTADYLAHAENRITICKANYLLFNAKKDYELAEQARAGVYNWISKAQDNLEAHY